LLTWEQQPPIIKTDYVEAKNYFERIVKATDTYEQNAGGGTAGRNRYESANQMADYGNEIREYIQQLTSAGAASATNTAANVQTKENMSTMEVEIKKLTATIAAMATKLTNNENKDPNAEGATGDCSRRPQSKKIRNMGAYCHSDGFHLVGADDNNTMLPPPGPTDSAVTCFGHLQNASPSNNMITPRGKESQPPPTDRDRELHRARKTIVALPSLIN